VPVDYAPKQSLREKFKEKGLQVIVKMASIELTPEKPEFPAGSWHVSKPLWTNVQNTDKISSLRAK
jgi:hypothetical protein